MTKAKSAGTGKDTVYIDVDDEITTIIEKLRNSPERIVALVLPKRATVFQSIVNMKLLKRTADNAKKHVVLVTTEAALMPLAGSVGLYVADTPQSKPEIPVAPGKPSEVDAIEEAELDDDEPEYTAENAGNRPVGELAGAGAIETVALDNDEEVTADTPAAVKPKRFKKDKKLKVPNFNKFRLLLAVGAAVLLLLIFGLVYALKVMPKATITIKTDASDVNSNLTLTLDSKAKTLNKESLTVPAKVAQEQKTQSQQVAATGSKNNGEKATGSVTMNAGTCSADVPADVPAGTGLSSSGLTFITQESTGFVPKIVGGKCVYVSDGSTKIGAQAGGVKYNVNNATFSVAGRSGMTATGSADGGTDSIVKVVTQGDIDSATQKISTSADTTAIKDSLTEDLHVDGLFALPDTFDAGEPSITTTSAVGDQAENVTVTATYTYKMYGVKKDDLNTLVNDDIKSQVDTSKETILTNGVDKATVRVLSGDATTKKISFQTTGTVGPELYLDQIKQQAAGKKPGNVEASIKMLPGVTDANVEVGPFWVSSVPNNTSKITVVVKKANEK